ncbi:MAG: hypothetical protein M1819_003762 [Sarea resinae]|nr:MAG: hypothetical protein M1819_003762 [Sarea resinae]
MESASPTEGSFPSMMESSTRKEPLYRRRSQHRPGLVIAMPPRRSRPSSVTVDAKQALDGLKRHSLVITPLSPDSEDDSPRYPPPLLPAPKAPRLIPIRETTTVEESSPKNLHPFTTIPIHKRRRSDIPFIAPSSKLPTSVSNTHNTGSSSSSYSTSSKVTDTAAQPSALIRSKTFTGLFSRSRSGLPLPSKITTSTSASNLLTTAPPIPPRSAARIVCTPASPTPSFPCHAFEHPRPAPRPPTRLLSSLKTRQRVFTSPAGTETDTKGRSIGGTETEDRGDDRGLGRRKSSLGQRWSLRTSGPPALSGSLPRSKTFGPLSSGWKSHSHGLGLADSEVHQPEGQEVSEVPTNIRQIHTARPTSYWSGRLSALQDRFRNEDFTVADRLTSLEQLTTTSTANANKNNCPLPPTHDPVPTANMHSLATLSGGPQPLSADDRRLRRAFIHLRNLCITEEAKESLADFQHQYATTAKEPAALSVAGAVKEKNRLLGKIMGRTSKKKEKQKQKTEEVPA